MPPSRILLVSRDPDFAGIYASALRHAGHVVLPTYTPDDALSVAARERPDLAIVDFPTTAGDGATVTELLCRDGRTAAMPVVAITARVVGAELGEALRRGAVRVLGMPLAPTALIDEVARLLDPS